MNSRSSNLFRFFFVCVDLLALNIVYFVLVLSTNKVQTGAEHQYMVLFIVANMVWLLASYSTALYLDNASLDLDLFARRTMKTMILFIVVMICFIFLYHFAYSRIFVMISFAAFCTILLAARGGLIARAFYRQKKNKSIRKVVIVGYNTVAKKLAYNFTEKDGRLSVEGYFEDPRHIHELSDRPIIGDIDECINYAINNRISEIYSTISPETNSSIYDMAQTAEKSLIRFKFVPDLKLYVNRDTHLEYLDELPILSLRPEPLEDLSNSIRKRVFDIVFSLVVIVFVLSWLTPLLAILIKLSSPGPVFFRQWRSGKDNKPFRVIKFRSLAVNQDAHTKQVTRGDSRITPVGKFLRKTNLDELPQFFNVLAGAMSVVGPRPHMLQHTETYSKILGQYMIRHFVKPGVTGWAQVNGFRGEIKREDQLRKRIEHDIWYLEHWSSWLDIRIILLTGYVTIKGDKNAF
ncbi:MAG: undecaprenyl-phosphate glucose phosphotransferase [Chitinophagaceae bacterium]|nr:undecaprenyl-phosphate glucose phosphotransferase [Chitinophagaceae bacterium]